MDVGLSARSRAIVVGVLVLVWLATAWWLYRPTFPRPYETADFPDFLAILRASRSPFDAFRDLVAYYLPHGRLNLGAFALMTGKWYIFGEDMVFWRLLRVGEMCLLAWLLYLFLRRVGVGPFGAYAATWLMLASPPAAMNWWRMSVAEPPATTLLLVLCLLLLGYPRRLRETTRLSLIALVVIAIGLTKEAILAAVPLPAVLLPLVARPDRPSWRAVFSSARTWTVVAAGFVVCVPLVVVAVGADTAGYSGLMGDLGMTPASFFMPLLASVLPFAPLGDAMSLVDILALIVYVGVLAAGWGALMRTRESKPRWVLFLAIGWPMAGAVVYALWPYYRLFYALPFQLGTAVLVGLAVTHLVRIMPSLKATLYGALTIVAVPMLTFAHWYSRYSDASVYLTHATARELGEAGSGVRVTMEVCEMKLQGHWETYGPYLERYTRSLGLAAPSVSEVACQARAPAPLPPGHWRMVLSSHTSPGAEQALVAAYTHRSFDWRRWRVREDSLIVTTWHE
jgi:hypothetical protein